MSNAVDRQEIIASLINAGKSLGLLAQDDTIFRATVDAFRAVDGESFQRLLTNLKITDCELVCFWLRSKECVLECIELCGVPRQPITVDDIPKFAAAVVKITGDEELIERLADTVRDRDAQGFSTLVKELKIEPYCHLLCHWACMVHWRLVCEVACAPRPIPQKDFVSALATAGACVQALLQDRAKIAAVIKAAVAFDCQALTSIFGQQGDCFYICEWICSWRCILVCLPLCRAFPPGTDTSIEEMRAFAQAAARLAAKEGAFASLVDAVLAQNADTFATLVKQLEVGPFCLQLCHWICFGICKLFCVCVCPPAPTIPLFTHVGEYKITTDFAADGTTTAGNLAFTSTIPLIGIMPDGTAPDALEYHFQWEKYPLGGGPADITSGMIPASRIGELEYLEWDAGLTAWVPGSADYWVNNPGATATIPQQFGPPLVVPVNKDVKPGGWIEVPRENSLFIGGVGRFIPDSGILANLDTTQLTNESFDLTVAAPPLPLKAGNSVPSPADRSEVPHFKIYFEARKILGAVPVGANNLDKIALSNAHFKYIRHLDWAGYTVTPPSGDSILVLSLDVQELLAGGCSPLSKDVHALFTAYHPYLGTCQVYLEGPGIPPPAAVNPPISADGQAVSPAGGQDFDISKLGPCAYIVWISATLRLTVGYGAVYGTFYDHIAFCIR
jgi:hypothetical protein